MLGFVDPDEKGLGGIEYELDSQIRGKSEKIVVMADARQRWFDGSEAQRERGANVTLTLDEKIQYIAQRELAAAIAKTHAQAGSVIVMNPNNGEILALANWPTFNPNMATDGRRGSADESVGERRVRAGIDVQVDHAGRGVRSGTDHGEDVFDCENGSIYLTGTGFTITSHLDC